MTGSLTLRDTARAMSQMRQNLRDYLLDHPWLLFLFYAVLFGGLTQLLQVVLWDDSFSLLEGVVSGLLFGAAMTAIETRRLRGRSQDAHADS